MADTSQTREEWLWEEWSSLVWGVRRSIRYHSRRRMFFDRWHTITSATGVIFGSATFFALLSQADPRYAQSAALVVTIMATIDLVVGTAQSARLHDDLSRRFIAIEQQIERAEEPTETLLRELKALRLEIEAEEPPVLRVLDSLCFNELARAEGKAQEEFIKIRFYQRWFAQFLDIQEHRMQKYPDLGQAGGQA